MNNRQTTKFIAYFPRRWLTEVLERCRWKKGFLHHLRTYGHLSVRLTSTDNDPKKYSVANLLRVFVNMAMVMTEHQFMEWWVALGNSIYKYADAHGDEFNEQYKK